MSNNEVLYIITPKEGDICDMELLHQCLNQSKIHNHFNVGLTSHYLIPYLFNKEITEHILTHGLSSILNFKISMEDITSPSYSVDEIESIILKFLSQLNGSKEIIVTDPYIYNIKNEDFDLFEKIIKSFCDDLEKLIFVTKADKKYQINKDKLHKIIKKIKPNIKIIDINLDDFHDRFWISVNKKIGIVIGTSLNGITKKIALIDKLSVNNTEDIFNEFYRLNILSQE